MRTLILITTLGATAALAACAGAAPTTRGTSPRATAAARSAAPAAAATFVIIGENTSASQITATHAPYLVKTLKPHAAWLTTYHSFTKSSSLGNYIAMTSGQFTRCEAHNDLPDRCHQNIDNVFQQLQRAGKTWTEFSEGAANPCDIVDHGAAWSKNIYSAHHNPALYYTALHGKGYDEAITPSTACRQHNLAMGTTAPNDTSTMDATLRSGEVSDLNVIIPNDCENGHDPCATKDPVRQFDDFLAREIPKIQASPAYDANSRIIITWDEGADKPRDPGNPLLLAIGSKIHPALVSSGSYTHYSLLRTIEDGFSLPRLAHAKTAKALPL
ncbi:MAG: phosphatidylinositol-3-phosphatase [Solirubrobacteraceae bacterium]|jgi:hypothetical protein|nr:phosphatidylinositol-3-phosphatase [Solirubrobacteraceae bacterium]